MSEPATELDPGTNLEIVEEPATDIGGGLFSNDEFQKRVEIIMAAIEDPEKHRRAIAEIHTYLSLIVEGFAQMQMEMMSGGGPMALIRKMMGGK